MTHAVPIFIISLKKDIERRNAITHALSAQNLSWVIIDAVEGSQLKDSYLSSLNYKYGEPSHANEIACSLSHQSTYKKIVDSDAEWAIILEDDAIIDTPLSGFIDELENGKTSLLKKDYIYLLGGQEGLNSRKRLSLSFFNKIQIDNVVLRKVTYKPSKLYRACCYLIHRDECKKLINLFNETYYVADSWDLFYKLNKVKGYFLAEVIKHPIVNIDNSNIERYRINKNNPRRKKGFIESKISLFFLQIRRFFRSLKY
ncbi:glycosyltransferase family 25 protein [Providencia stuartii]|uniref:glycosyltransferase family 25 protein n=1 Tax=Providencia sp. 2023EL-00965 TaxID=3084975 RepID=UPI0027F184F9|nr:glycosyltransferase family 25 protein [Providencia sp. 2023EL-00965]ELR5301597.1 glycosyltransferase family 25 protein [Providencia stuartii]MDW7590065.1 glycosyltransferase family 25 protein [Providencia sp. 2023EL-00965]